MSVVSEICGRAKTAESSKSRTSTQEGEVHPTTRGHHIKKYGQPGQRAGMTVQTRKEQDPLPIMEVEEQVPTCQLKSPEMEQIPAHPQGIVSLISEMPTALHPPPYLSPPLSTPQYAAESSSTTSSPFAPSSPLSQQLTLSPLASSHNHRAYQQAQDRAKARILSGVRSRKKTDAFAMALKDKTVAIKLLSLENRTLQGDNARMQAEKAAAVADVEIAKLHETIRASKAEGYAEVLQGMMDAMKAVEAVKLEANEKVLQSRLEVAQTRLEVEARVKAAEEKVKAAEEKNEALSATKERLQQKLDEATKNVEGATIPNEEMLETKNMMARMFEELATINLQLQDTKAELKRAKQETVSAWGKWTMETGQKEVVLMGKKIMLDQGMRKLSFGGGRGQA